MEPARILPADPAHPGPIDGYIDHHDRTTVEGWGLDLDWPDRPVRLEVLDGGQVIGRTVANRYRPDLAQAGKGNGECSFVFRFATPPLGHITVRRASDSAMLTELRDRQAAA